MKPLLQREWLLTRWPLAGALVAQLTFLLVQAPRTYATVRESDPSIIGLLLAAWLGYHRVYAEQKRGTWLLQPFSRTQLVLAKVFHASAALLLFALVESLSRYVWVCTSASPGGPILSLFPYLQEALSVVLGTCLALLFATVIASFSERPWQQVASIAAGLAWVVFLTVPDHQLRLLNGNGDLIEMPTRAWRMLGPTLAVGLGTAVALTISRDTGRRPSTQLRVLSSLWRAPVGAVFLLAVLRFLPSPASAPYGYDSNELLLDGEIVNAHFDRNGGRGVRRDGREVRLSTGPAAPSERVVWARATTSPLPFGSTQWSPMGQAFVAEDGRSLLLYDQDTGVRVACFGASGLQRGDADCPPGARILSSMQLGGNRPSGLLVVRENGVHVLDTLGAHERHLGDGVLGATSLGEVIAVITEGALHITGRIERTCPHVTARALLGILDDDTVVMLDANMLMYCRADGVTESMDWPAEVDTSEPALNVSAGLLFPAFFDVHAARATLWLALFARVLGAVILLALYRKRGIAHALLALVIGPAYVLAALSVELDRNQIAIWRKRFVRESSAS